MRHALVASLLLALSPFAAAQSPCFTGLVFDDANAFSYLSDNKAGCIDHLKEMIAQRCAKQVEVQLRLNEGGRSAANTVPDLRQLINFDIEEENF